ncbi:TetR/AcrR family transcriptional regulator [Actinomadura madurae]|uniref:TetR/AcrR family transcriptional regulator n=1 Tax=Actinomadura madurae TaxID=1993 RepID=UPI0035562165
MGNGYCSVAGAGQLSGEPHIHPTCGSSLPLVTGDPSLPEHRPGLPDDSTTHHDLQDGLRGPLVTFLRMSSNGVSAMSRGYAKGRARRREILLAALNAFAEQGFRATSMREIAEMVGLSQAACCTTSRRRTSCWKRCCGCGTRNSGRSTSVSGAGTA